MKPMVFSMKNFQKHCPKDFDFASQNPLKQTEFWQRDCENISYTQNEIPRYTINEEQITLNNHNKFI